MLTFSKFLSVSNPSELSACLVPFLESPSWGSARTLVRVIFCYSAKPEADCACQCTVRTLYVDRILKVAEACSKSVRQSSGHPSGFPKWFPQVVAASGCSKWLQQVVRSDGVLSALPKCSRQGSPPQWFAAVVRPACCPKWSVALGNPYTLDQVWIY